MIAGLLPGLDAAVYYHLRTVPTNGLLRTVIGEHLKKRQSASATLITNAAGQCMVPSTFRRIFRRILKRAGLEDSGITAHSLRPRPATQLICSGADAATVAELLGDANVSTTFTYLHASGTTKQAAVELMEEAFRSGVED